MLRKPDIRIPVSFLLISLLFLPLNGKDLHAADQEAGTITLELVFNPSSYPWLMGKKYPQIAVWVVDPSSGKTETVFATRSAAKNQWAFAKKRPASLPVWYGIKGKKMTVDTISSATPSGKQHTISWNIPGWAKGKKLDIYIEANVSFDYNERYAKKLPKDSPYYNNENGQPSLVWKGRLNLAVQDAVEPELLGRGHPTGKDNKLSRDLRGITTAKKLFHHLMIRSKP